jgi:N-acetylmuramoyl-L-alanine amidase
VGDAKSARAAGEPGLPRPGLALRACAAPLACVALLALAACCALPARAAPAAGPEFESARVVRIGGTDYLAAGDLARLLDATRFWRSDVRKLVLRTGAHRVTLTVDDPFAVVDDRTLWLRAPVLSRRGELQAPLTLLAALPGDSTIPALVYEARRGLVLRVPRGGLVRSPEVLAGDTLTRVIFPVERTADITIAGRARARFLVRFAGTFAGVLPETLPPGSLVRRIVPAAAATGSAFELELAPGAAGFRVVHAARPAVRGGPGTAAAQAVVLEFPRLRQPGLEDFALEGRPARVRVIVLDPGHGGGDAGVSVADEVEKDLTLTLARLVRTELARRLPVQIVLTRDDDRPLSPEQRAEVANRARADLVLSLHFDAVPGTQRSGATAWCPPARVGTPEGPVAPRAPITLLPWREVALRRAVQSRAAAEAISDALEQAGAGPARVRERLMVPMLGVDAPGLELDCATLSAIPDRIRVEDPRGLQQLAAAIADGIARWARGG